MPMSRTFLANRSTHLTSRWALPLLILIALALQGCQGEGDTNQQSSSTTITMPKPTASDFAPLRQHRIFFMHQSVGKNLMDGVDLLARDAGIDIPLEQRDASGLSAGFSGNGIIHAYGGKNRFPETKIRSFAEQLAMFPENGRPDVAVMKFCFIDFDTDTDVDGLFRQYTAAIDSLEKRYPHITFTHMTVPLMAFPHTLKARVKRLLGMSVWVDVTNAKREAFSQRIRDRYPANRIFDIARYESTHPDGMREKRSESGQTIYGLVPAYTRDGSHLNANGQRYVARGFLAFLHNLSTPSQSSDAGEQAN